MSHIHEIRAAIDTKLDAWEKQALALEARLTETKDKAADRLEEQKRRLREVLARVQAEVAKSKDLAGQTRAEVQAKLDHLREQLTLGKAEARDAFEQQRRNILDALAAFEASADEKLKGGAFESGKIWEDLVVKANALEAELDAFRTRFGSETAKQQARFEEKKQELMAKLAAFKNDFQARRHAIRTKADTFERDFAAGLEGIKAAFRKLFE
jgi:hypothetical protein